MLFDDTYFTIEKESTGEYRERGSRFLGTALPIRDEAQVKEILQKFRKSHPQANHHCYAYRLTPDPGVFRFSDDREPSGSAGKPILGAILSKGVTDVLVVVVRYFGGTLLGVPGLIQAYRSAAQEALHHSKLVEKHIQYSFKIVFPYELTNEVFHVLRTSQVQIKSHEQADTCSIIFDIRKNLASEIERKILEHPILSHRAFLESL
ncbi:MAG: YigZ family protein [Bacteroidia bacterium]|nr:YigZ family protein [Bacteroidia bacterium]